VFWRAVWIATAACRNNRPLPEWISDELFTIAGRLDDLAEKWDKGEEVAGRISAALNFTTGNKTAFNDYYELLRNIDILTQYEYLRLSGSKEVSAVAEVASRMKITPRQVQRIVSRMRRFWKESE
jgi:hypothetical protein